MTALFLTKSEALAVFKITARQFDRAAPEAVGYIKKSKQHDREPLYSTEELGGLFQSSS